MANRKSFDGWTALVTGGAGGLGRAIARVLVERGIRCLLVDIDAARLETAVKSLGPMALPFVADLTDECAMQALVEHVKSRFGRLDLLVNNAGIISNTPFEIRPMPTILHEVSLNMLAPIAITQALLPLLRCAADGRVITIVSLGGIFPMPETCVYSATKFGLRGAMLCLGLDGPRLGVKLTIVNPSATETPMLMREAIEDGNKMQFMDPPQMPEDVARTVLRALDKPSIECFVRPSESWSARLAMLMPNILPKVIPLFRRKSEAGHRRYLTSLESRGLIRRHGEGWQLNLPER
ncbi:SDR family NAD(P)-dependent oxidoreductase [Burkholderia pyrrocinia]|uniref:SDR family NAD(P)-dependent oxidoreductase n=1 Tax=Burkholderia vietnamiensis TaxID=60552 RepID=UPI0026514E0F|nr:SDR family oxidoreductase [Burkholderia vietnamiensis]MDN8076442.1 SDR family oxidoreductase [Burkholderia vietnamiensis]HDR8985500.1 SDR family oxidoreductase [Burkholderia vietnamiensis]